MPVFRRLTSPMRCVLFDGTTPSTPTARRANAPMVRGTILRALRVCRLCIEAAPLPCHATCGAHARLWAVRTGWWCSGGLGLEIGSAGRGGCVCGGGRLIAAACCLRSRPCGLFDRGARSALLHGSGARRGADGKTNRTALWSTTRVSARLGRLLARHTAASLYIRQERETAPRQVILRIAAEKGGTGWRTARARSA